MTGNEPLLPVIDRPAVRNTKWQNIVAAGLRILLLSTIAFGLRLCSQSDLKRDSDGYSVNLKEARKVAPSALDVGELKAARQDVQIPDSDERLQIVTTVPEANDVIGYRGPSHCLMLIDADNRIQKIALLNSRDTQEHVELVASDAVFWRQFEGWKLGEMRALPQVDAVSGATLTSLAVAEGVARRIGTTPASLKFPQPLSDADIRSMWPKLSSTDIIQNDGRTAVAFDRDGELLGTLIRTGVLNDRISGYQGPTELLVLLDQEQRIADVQKRSTWDNQPYASYMDDEPWYWDPFRNQTLRQIADNDLKELGIEGVSGATMTSVAAAETLIAAAAEWTDRVAQDKQKVQHESVFWSWPELATVVFVMSGCLIALTRLRSHRRLMFGWNVFLVVVPGLVLGQMISLVLIFGWATSGIGYLLAPGLTFLVAIAFVVPVVSKRNIYCSHLCPHGAAQQLLRNKRFRSFRIPRKVTRALTWLPGLLLCLAAIAMMIRPDSNLAVMEPFNAYIWYVSGLASIVLAIGSLIWSASEPMAWCRYGCATGRLLNYVRRSAKSHQITFADIIAVALAVLVFAIFLMRE